MGVLIFAVRFLLLCSPAVVPIACIRYRRRHAWRTDGQAQQQYWRRIWWGRIPPAAGRLPAGASAEEIRHRGGRSCARRCVYFTGSSGPYAGCRLSASSDPPVAFRTVGGGLLGGLLIADAIDDFGDNNDNNGA